jgi:transposase
MKSEVPDPSRLLAIRRRRRSWSADAKRRIVAESMAPGASMAEVARRHEVNPNLLFSWRRQAAKNAVADQPGAVAFVPIAITPEPPSAAGRMEIVVEGARIVVGADVDAAALARVVKALTAQSRRR